MLILGGRAEDAAAARAMLNRAVDSGRAERKLMDWIAAQGGDVSVLGDPPSMARAPIVEVVGAPRSGVIAQIDAREVGLAAVTLGAGRRVKGEPIDHAVGIVLDAKVGDRVGAGEALFTIHASDQGRCDTVRDRILGAYRWGDETVEVPPLLYEVIS